MKNSEEYSDRIHKKYFRLNRHLTNNVDLMFKFRNLNLLILEDTKV